MAWGCFVDLLLLVAAPLRLGQHLHLKPGLEYSCDYGVRGMQLLVFPRPNQTIKFKVLDEFGNWFEVNNCSICYHWGISEAQDPAVFSADCKGCHGLEKDGQFHLRVFIQAVLPNGGVDIPHDVTLICPKPDHFLTPDPYLALKDSRGGETLTQISGRRNPPRTKKRLSLLQSHKVYWGPVHWGRAHNPRRGKGVQPSAAEVRGI